MQSSEPAAARRCRPRVWLWPCSTRAVCTHLALRRKPLLPQCGCGKRCCSCASPRTNARAKIAAAGSIPPAALPVLSFCGVRIRSGAISGVRAVGQRHGGATGLVQDLSGAVRSRWPRRRQAAQEPAQAETAHQGARQLVRCVPHHVSYWPPCSFGTRCVRRRRHAFHSARLCAFAMPTLPHRCTDAPPINLAAYMSKA